MNLPNKISLTRIILIPVMIFFFCATFIPYNYLIALVVLIVASITDAIDGNIARKRNLITNLGKFLDPIADKLLIISALLLACIYGVLPPVYGAIVSIIFVSRELTVSVLRQIAASKNIIMAADNFGKIKMVVQSVAIPFLFLLAQIKASGWLSGNWLFGVEITTYVLIGVATLFTLASGINYLVKNRAVFKD